MLVAIKGSLPSAGEFGALVGACSISCYYHSKLSMLVGPMKLRGNVPGSAGRWVRFAIIKIREGFVPLVYFLISWCDACTQEARRPCFPDFFNVGSILFLPEVFVLWAVSGHV